MGWEGGMEGEGWKGRDGWMMGMVRRLDGWLDGFEVDHGGWWLRRGDAGVVGGSGLGRIGLQGEMDGGMDGGGDGC